MTIDNGNHLLLSGNHAALAYLDDDRRARTRWSGPATAGRSRSSISRPASAGRCAINDGVCRGGSSIANRRVPGTQRARLSVAAASCCGRGPMPTVGDVIDCAGPLYDRLLEPLLLAALNIDPPEGSAALAARGDARDAAAGGTGLPSADRARRA